MPDKIYKGYALTSTGQAIPIGDPGAVRDGDKILHAVNSDKLGDVEAEQYALKTDTVANTDKLGGKPPEAYAALQLLGNSWFGGVIVDGVKLGIINKNGYISGTTGQNNDAIDGWILQESTTLTFYDGFVRMGGAYSLYQKVKHAKAGSYTIAAKMRASGGSRVLSLVAQSSSNGLNARMNVQNSGDWVTVVCNFSIAQNTTDLTVYPSNNGNTSVATDVEWIALYSGTYTSATLPPFVPTHPRIENLKLGNPVQPPNLLVNSNFRNPINSRGITSPNGPGYYIDEWKTGNSPAAYSIVNGVGITMTANDREGIYWDQALPYADCQKYVGKHVTLAFSTDRGLLVRSVVVPSNGYDRASVGNGVGLTVGNMDGAFWADIFITSGETITLYWAALYEGTYNAETLPPFVPTHPRIENLKIENQVQPENLLDNSDWRVKENIINQRGQTSYSGGASIDRWLAWGSLTINNGYISANSIGQRVPKSKLTGWPVTIAAKHRNGSVSVFTITNPLAVGAAQYGSIFEISGTDVFLYIGCGDGYEFEWWALYEGAYTSATLPPFVPRPYTVELAECQRYYVKNDMIYISKSCYGTMYILCNVVFPVPMRWIPETVNIYSRGGTLGAVSFWDNNIDAHANVEINRATLSLNGFNAITVPSNDLIAEKTYSFSYEASCEP